MHSRTLLKLSLRREIFSTFQVYRYGLNTSHVLQRPRPPPAPVSRMEQSHVLLSMLSSILAEIPSDQASCHSSRRCLGRSRSVSLINQLREVLGQPMPSQP